jgi:hypothetical protein
MRVAFGSSYGISVTLPASYWYLRWFDPIAMQPYVDFFGLMTYDLHGPWDAEVKQIGQIVYGQTNIPEIYNWTLPLWYDGLDPSKINFGLAYYGRGYTLKDENCNTIGCGWSGPSRPGPCTNFAGIMSLQELESIVIPSLGIQPTLLETDMMKQLTWGDQWIGYDDMATIAMKKQWASSHCYGGTMIWSIDLYSGPGSGNTPDGLGSSVTGDPAAGGGQDGSSESSNSSAIVYIDPSIWQESEPVINCQPPCTFILPPLVLPTPTTITFPLYTTSLDVAWSESTGWTSIVQTTTLTIPPLTTTAIEVWEYTVTDASTNTGTKVISSFYVTSSVRPPPFTITDDPNPLSISGVSHPPVTRTITPPPYPYLFTTPDTPATTATTSTSSSTVAAAIFPCVTYKPGPDGPICKRGCGFPCLIFCDYPCLICPDGGNDFADPINPNPPPRPTPSPVEDPIPSGPTVTPPPDPSGTAPADPDEEDLDQECALEFSLPLPTYRGTIGQTTTSVSIATPPPAPSPSPPPPPAPPAPNPATESYHCYDSGSWISRAAAIQAIDNFCNTWDGTVLDASQPNTLRTLTSYSYEDCIGDLDACFVQTIVSVTVINGCRFTMDGPSPDQDCGRILREPIDKCNTASTQFKQGGTVTSNCAEWRIDPGVYW